MKGFRFHRELAGSILAACVCLGGGTAAAQIPDAPPMPACTWGPVSSQPQSSCRFKTELSGTATSVAGNRVILYCRSAIGGHGASRKHIEQSLLRLADRYGFTATVSEDPAVFTAANLAKTKVVIMAHGDGDVVPQGPHRTALQDFQMVNGWGVIWLHAACAFITSGWPFGQQSCVQQYYQHDPSGTKRRVYVDSGTADIPYQGIKNPQTEFLLRALPGWSADRTIAWNDQFHCFQAPARNTLGVNVLLGYDRSSGLPVNSDCFNRNDGGETGSQSHNLAWTHAMGKGIAIVNSIGHDESTYVANSNAGDSLLWRFIRYAAKDWEDIRSVGAVFEVDDRKVVDPSVSAGTLTLTFGDPGSHAVTVSDVSGRRVFARTFDGVTRADIPDLKRGIYVVKVVSKKASEARKVRLL